MGDLMVTNFDEALVSAFVVASAAGACVEAAGDAAGAMVGCTEEVSDKTWAVFAAASACLFTLISKSAVFMLTSSRPELAMKSIRSCISFAFMGFKVDVTTIEHVQNTIRRACRPL